MGCTNNALPFFCHFRYRNEAITKKCLKVWGGGGGGGSQYQSLGVHVK